MNMDYRYFLMNNRLYYDELSTMSLLYANSIYMKGKEQPLHSGVVIKDLQNLSSEGEEGMETNGVNYKNLRVKDLMEFYGFKDVRTYYMGSPGDMGDENKEDFNEFIQQVNGKTEMRISEDKKDNTYKYIDGDRNKERIGTKYKDIDEIYLSYKDTHKGSVAIGYKNIEYHGIDKTVIGIVIRGTAEDDDWDSDFDK